MAHAAFPERASAILALGLASQQPHFTLVAEGAITITISHYLAVFHIILLFLQVAPQLWDLPASWLSRSCLRRGATICRLVSAGKH